MVHAVHEHRRVVLARSGLDHFFGTRIDVGLAGFLGQEKSGAFNHDVGFGFVPLQFGRVLDRCQADLLPIHNECVAIDRNVTLEAAMHGVVLEHIGQIGRFKQIVDRNDFDFRKVFDCGAEHHASDTAKSVDTYTNRHLNFPL